MSGESFVQNKSSEYFENPINSINHTTDAIIITFRKIQNVTFY